MMEKKSRISLIFSLAALLSSGQLSLAEDLSNSPQRSLILIDSSSCDGAEARASRKTKETSPDRSRTVPNYAFIARKKILPLAKPYSQDISVLEIEPAALPPITSGPALSDLDLPISLVERKEEQDSFKADGYSYAIPKSQESYEELRKLIEEKKWKAATELAEKMYLSDARDCRSRKMFVDASCHYGVELKKLGSLKEAIFQFYTVLYLDPENQAGNELSACLKELGINPDDPVCRRELAAKAKLSGDIQTAIVEYQIAQKLEPKIEDHAELGNLYLDAGEIPAAYSHLSYVLRSKNWPASRISELGSIHKELAGILYEFAYIAKKRGRGSVGMRRLLNSWQEYRNALRFNPDDKQCKERLVDIANEAVKIRPSIANYFAIATACVLDQKKEAALLYIAQLKRLDPAYKGIAELESAAVALNPDKRDR